MNAGKQLIERIYLNDNTTIKFKYIGFDENLTNNTLQIENKLDRVFKDYYQTSILSVVRDIRTILKNLNETYLEISISNNFTELQVTYINGQLSSYKEEKYIDKENKVIFNYKKDNKYDFNFSGTENEDYPCENLVSLFEDYVKTKRMLQKISGITLDYNDELLFKVYKIFYDENPDLCDKNINIKIQTMIAVLTQFNICLNYPLSVYTQGKMPQNLNLSEKIKTLRALEKIDTCDLTSVKLVYSHEKEIKEIGKIMRENDIDLITLSKIVHAENYDLSEKSNINQVIQFTKCNEEEIRQGIQLVKRIKNIIG